MLKVFALSFDYEEVPLLNQIGFTVNPGQLLHLRGKNGVGKTTLLKLLAGLLQANSGEIVYGEMSIRHHLTAYQQDVCYLGHKLGLSSSLSIRENYHFGLYEPNKISQFDNYLQQFDLVNIAEKPCGQLSVGQRRRAALLQLMMRDANLWLLDEPFTSLDKETVSFVMKKIGEHLKRQGMVIMSSHHDLPINNFETQEYCL